MPQISLLQEEVRSSDTEDGDGRSLKYLDGKPWQADRS